MSINKYLSSTDWVVAALMLFGLIGGIIYFFIGDKLTRIEHRKRINELENLSFDLLISVLTSFKMSKNNVKILNDNPLNYERKITELVCKLSNIGCCSKRRFKNYIESVKNYKKNWDNLVGVNTNSRYTEKFTHEREKLIKNITKLGNSTGRTSESEKIKK